MEGRRYVERAADGNMPEFVAPSHRIPDVINRCAGRDESSSAVQMRQ